MKIEMKFTRAALWSATGIVTTTTLRTNAFAPVPATSSSPFTTTSARNTYPIAFTPRSILENRNSSGRRMSSSSSSSLDSYTVGIVGATGAVGKEILGCLENRGILQIDKLRFFGSKRSSGKTVATKSNGDVEIELFDVEAARSCDVVFLAVDGDFALAHAKAISDGDDGAIVIDNSSAFRYEPDIPLVVPEINGDCTKGSKLIANPNCTTAIGLMALWPLIKAFGVKKVLMSTYQASSGAGQPGMDELTDGTKAYLEGDMKSYDGVENSIFAYPLPFNVIPQIDKFQSNGYTKEEMKVTWESRKICDLGEDVPISCSAVRIPTIRAHSEVIVLETKDKVDLDKARQVLEDAPGVDVKDNPDTLTYPMPLTATGKYNVEVGRIRKSLAFGDYGLEFFVCGDQLLRGAALNAVLVAEEMDKNGALSPS